MQVNYIMEKLYFNYLRFVLHTVESQMTHLSFCEMSYKSQLPWAPPQSVSSTHNRHMINICSKHNY
jgi:uncharacterized protein YfbU (UPF0304 family)